MRCSRPVRSLRYVPSWLCDLAQGVIGRQALIGVVMLGALTASEAASAQQTATNPARRAQLRKDGFLVVDGQPFFPVGIYHDSLDADRYGEQLLADFELIAAARFNCVALSMDFTFDGQDAASSTAGRIANRAQELGVHLVPHVYLPQLEQFARDHASWSSILMSSIGDDFNTDEDGRFEGPPKYPPQRLRQLSQQVKQVAPGQLTYSSGLAHPAAQLQGYETAVDVLGIQCYPFEDGNQSWRNELEATNDLLENYWSRSGPQVNPALWANLQAFAWKPNRAPAPAEMRAQAWLAILARVRGILWYSYLSYDDKQPLPSAHPSLWREIRDLVPEIHALAPYLVDGTFTAVANPANARFDDGPGTWHAGVWHHRDGVLLVVANTDRQQPRSLDFVLPGLPPGAPLRPLSAERYPAALRVEQRRVRGQVAPRAVEVLLWPSPSRESP